MKAVIVSEKIKDTTAYDFLSERYEMILLPPNKTLMPAEATHADMQMCVFPDQKTVIASPDIEKRVISRIEKHAEVIIGKTRLSPEYPHNIAYNVLKTSKYYFHNLERTDPVLKNYLEKTLGLIPVNVKQGYSGCSGIYASAEGEKGVLITSDSGIYNAAKALNEDCFLFENPKRIRLEGLSNGCIGGCCGFDSDVGIIVKCKEECADEELKKYLRSHNITLKCIGDSVMTDIGGFWFV